MPTPDEQDLMTKLGDAIMQLRSQLVDEIVAQSPTKMPVKVELLRQVLLHRALDLCVAAEGLYREHQAVPACVLSRAVMETVGLLIWLWEKVNVVCSDDSLGDIDQFLRRAILGTRSAEQPVEAYNAITAVDRTVRIFERYREMYDGLSEYAHPNWEGVQGAYSSLDIEADTFRLGSSQTDVPSIFGLTCLVVCLELGLDYSARIVGLLPQFAEISERELGSAGT